MGVAPTRREFVRSVRDFPRLEQTVSGLVFRRARGHRRARVPLPWITPRVGAVCAPPSSASFERPRSATSLALRHFAAAGLRKERTPISPMPSCAQQDATARRGRCRHTRSGPEAACFRRSKTARFVGIGAWLGCQILERLGGRTRARTWDPMIKSHLLYQLSYAPGSWSGKPSQEGVV